MSRKRSGRGGTIRIIGGRWRGTRIAVLPRAELRPSSDRVRETLFNWLATVLAGARCLDLYAGTGALGFEALSRGAASADLVEADADLVAAMRMLAARLGADGATVHQEDVPAFLQRPPQHYDIVFVDPPFQAGLAERTLAALARGWVHPLSLVYVERARDDDCAMPGWTVAKRGQTRHVSYALLRYTG